MYSMDGESDSYIDRGMIREVVKEEISDMTNLRMNYDLVVLKDSLPQEIQEGVTKYFEDSSVWISKLSYSIKDVLSREGYVDRSFVQTELARLVSEEVVRQVSLTTALLREEMKPIFDMMKDPHLALSARVKSFNLE